MSAPKKLDKGGSPVYDFNFVNEQVFHLKNFYKHVYDWMVEQQFSSATGAKEAEVFYNEKRMQGGMTEHRIWWRFKKDMDPYVTYFIDIDWLTLGMTDTQTVYKGEKVKANKGEVTLMVRGYVRHNYDDIKKKNEKIFKIPIMDVLFSKFTKRIQRPAKEGYRLDLIRELQRLQEELKNYQDMVTYEPKREGFHPKRGL